MEVFNSIWMEITTILLSTSKRKCELNTEATGTSNSTIQAGCKLGSLICKHLTAMHLTQMINHSP